MIVLKTFLYIVSTFGLIGAVRVLTKLPASFCPAAAVCLQTIVLYVFALCGALYPGVWFTCAIGLAGFVFCCVKPVRFRALLDPGVLFFTAFSVIVAIVCSKMILGLYDNYTHWALITKEMALTNALPREGTMLTMTNYPPASAIYQYFFVKFFGLGEGAMLAAFNVTNGAMLACCFVGINNKKVFDFIFRLLLVTSLLFVVPNTVNNLQVDAFLGYCALAIGCAALTDEAFTGRGVAFQALVGSVLVLTKMSGIVLLVPHLALLLIRRRSFPSVKTKRAVTVLFVLAGVFAAAYLSYYLYSELTFSSVVNDFEVGVPAFKRISGTKSPEFWAVFPERFFQSFIDTKLPCNMYLYFGGGSFLLLLLCLFICRAKARRAVGSIVYALCTMLYYSVGLAVMYIFMMNENDSIIVASFERYFGTIVIYAIGIVFIDLQLCGGLFDAVPFKAAVVCYTLFSIVFTGLGIWSITHSVNTDRNEAYFEKSADAASLVADVPISPGSRIFVGADMTGVAQSLCYYELRYTFWTKDVLPLAPQYWYLGPKTGFYLVWIDDGEESAEILREEGIEIPESPGCYFVDDHKRATLVRSFD